MSYYGNDLDTAEAEASFDDPTAELEAGAQADDPEGDLGDGAFDPRKRRKVHEIDPSLIQPTRRIRG